MSQIFTDGAGNKYLGNLKWGNHDILYPNTNYLNTNFICNNLNQFSTAVTPFLTSAGFTSVSITTAAPDYNWGGWAGFYAVPPSGGPAINTRQFAGTGWDVFGTGNGVWRGNYFSYGNTTNVPYFMTMAAGNSFWHWLYFRYADNYSNLRVNTENFFLACGRLKNVNPNFSYYTNPANHTYCICFFRSSLNFNDDSRFVENNSFEHMIVGNIKSFLASGRAAYSVTCSDGQTPSAQWATDLWVYDNNPTLGFPVIGRVPNLLLGTGTYTTFKPVKIQGSAFPDAGSPWYLPVGRFAGKELLMRCYSDLT